MLHRGPLVQFLGKKVFYFKTFSLVDIERKLLLGGAELLDMVPALPSIMSFTSMSLHGIWSGFIHLAIFLLKKLKLRGLESQYHLVLKR